MKRRCRGLHHDAKTPYEKVRKSSRTSDGVASTSAKNTIDGGDLGHHQRRSCRRRARCLNCTIGCRLHAAVDADRSAVGFVRGRYRFRCVEFASSCGIIVSPRLGAQRSAHEPCTAPLGHPNRSGHKSGLGRPRACWRAYCVTERDVGSELSVPSPSICMLCVCKDDWGHLPMVLSSVIKHCNLGHYPEI